jgi:hypothetical protein
VVSVARFCRLSSIEKHQKQVREDGFRPVFPAQHPSLFDEENTALLMENWQQSVRLLRPVLHTHSLDLNLS